jgi:4-amino-4-deoxy-L-arabinose transferase-like glycosyltransferase
MEDKNKIDSAEDNLFKGEIGSKEEAKSEKEKPNTAIADKNLLEKRKEKIKNWLKNPENLAIAGVILFAFAIRLYYFWMTKNQPLWWDELCYGSLAKNFITHAWDGTVLIISETKIRPLIFPIIWSFLMRLQLNETASRFLLAFVPSMLSVIFIYLTAKEIFNKRVGLIAAAISSTIWLNLFYSSRFLVHMLDLALLFASIYFFVKSTKAEINLKYFVLSLVLLSLATLTRYPDGMIFFVYLIILILAKKLYLNKLKFWIMSIVGISPLLLFFARNYFLQGNIFPALFDKSYIKPLTVNGQVAPFAFNVLSYISVFLQTLFLIFFILGLIYLFFEIIVGYNLLAKNGKLRNALLLVLILLVFNSFFIFYLRSAEDRWLFETIICLVIISAVGINVFFEYLEKYNKLLAVLLVFGILLVGGYYQIVAANSIIQQKKESYLQMEQAFYWLKDNTPKDSIILGYGIEPYTVYYADRQYDRLELYNASNVSESPAGYMVLHGFVPQLDYVEKYLQENPDKWKPINVFFLDAQKQQPIVIIYQKQISNSSI